MNNIILTSFYTKIPDPQYKPDKKSRKKFVLENFDYMKKFYNSIIKFKLKCIIFHDGLSEEFINKYSNNKISFIKFDHNNYKTNSGNDTRYLVYYKFLSKHNFDKVIISDISGVEFISNPFTNLKDKKLYVAQDRSVVKKGNKRDLTHFWFKNYAIRAYGSFKPFENFKNEYSLTPKFFCGNFNLILEVLKEFKSEFSKVNLIHNTNYAVFNYIIYKKFKNRIIRGYSTHNGYKETILPNKDYILNIRNANVHGKFFWDI